MIFFFIVPRGVKIRFNIFSFQKLGKGGGGRGACSPLNSSEKNTYCETKTFVNGVLTIKYTI